MIEYILFPLSNLAWLISDFLSWAVNILAAVFAITIIALIAGSALIMTVYYLSEIFYYKRKRNHP